MLRSNVYCKFCFFLSCFVTCYFWLFLFDLFHFSFCCYHFKLFLFQNSLCFIYLFPTCLLEKKIFFCFVIVDTILTDTWLTDFLLSNVLWKIKYPWVCCYGDCAARDLKIFLRFFFPCHLQCLYSRPTSTLVLNAQMLPV